MPQPQAGKRQIVSREGVVTSWRVEHHVLLVDRSGRVNSRLHLDIFGRFTKPVKGVRAFAVSLLPVAVVHASKAEAPCVGSLISTKPVVHAVVSITEFEFETLIRLCVSRALRDFWCDLQDPQRRASSLVLGLMFTSEGTISGAPGQA